MKGVLHYKKCVNINAKDTDEQTPLHIACEKGHLPIVEYLLEKGADIEAKDKWQNTPLHFSFKSW